MKQILTVCLTMITLMSYAFGGGKVVAPVEAPVTPIPPTINPIPLYIGLGALASFVKRDGCSCSPGAMKDRRFGGMARVGYDFNNYFGLEARALKTFGSDMFSDVTHYGLYLKPQYHFMDQMNVYGLLGYGRTSVDYTNGIKSSTTSKNGLAYGLGFEYDFGSEDSKGNYDRTFDGQGDQEKGWGLWIDAQHLLNNEAPFNTDSNVITAGITYDF
jgi:opacity protein-like surface antigen